MLDIGFVVASGGFNSDPFRNQPLTLLYLMTILESTFGERIAISMIDLRGLKEDQFLSHIPEKDVYFYSVSTWDVDEAHSLVRMLRKVFPQSKHIAGGPHVSLFPDESKLIFDSVVLGECEEELNKIIEDVFAGELKPEYKQKGVGDLNKYPHPSRKYLAKEKVAIKGLLDGEHKNLLGTAVCFSRGCPFTCSFCATVNLTYGSARFRNPELITEEIEYLKREYQVESLALKDENAILFPQRFAAPFLEAIGKTGVKWRGQCRANGIPEELVRLAKDSGCTHLGLGIESASQKVLNLVDKGLDLVKARNFIQLLRKNGIGARIHIVLGLPGEDSNILGQTLDFIEESNPSSVLLGVLSPMPGSEMFENPEKFGMIIDKDAAFSYYRTLYSRFDESERPHMVFTYDKNSHWGKPLSNDQILDNYEQLQTILRERNLIF